MLALSKGMNAKDLTGVIHAYPTLAQINRRVADQRLKEGLTPTAKTCKACPGRLMASSAALLAGSP